MEPEASPSRLTPEQEIRSSLIWNAGDLFKVITAGHNATPEQAAQGIITIASALAAFVMEGKTGE